MKDSLSVIIPAYNEVESIGHVVSGLAKVCSATKNWEIIVVDDGSTDGTASNVTSPAKLIQHKINSGHGAAVKSGIRASIGDTIIIFDGDGQHNPDDIERLLEEIEKGADLVVGARGGLWAQRNGWGNLLVSSFASLLSGTKIPDLTSGLRAIKRTVAMEFLPYVPDRFCFELTTTMGCALRHYKLVFMKIEAQTRKTGFSKIRIFRDGIWFCYLMLRLAWKLKWKKA